MREIAFESVVESLAVVLEAIAMVLLTIIGVLAENTGLARLGSGVDPLTLWYVFAGAIALYAGVYMLGYGRFLPRVRGLAVGGE